MGQHQFTPNEPTTVGELIEYLKGVSKDTIVRIQVEHNNMVVESDLCSAETKRYAEIDFVVLSDQEV